MTLSKDIERSNELIRETSRLLGAAEHSRDRCRAALKTIELISATEGSAFRQKYQLLRALRRVGEIAREALVEWKDDTK